MTGLSSDEFDEWYRKVHPRLVGVITVATGDADVARDAVDEALVRACERWKRVSRMDAPAGWTFRVALNVAKRKQRRQTLENRLLRRSVAASPVPGPAGEMWLLVADLPSRQREAVVLRHVGQLTEAEVAAVMGVARGTVSSYLRAAYERLGAQVRAEEELGEPRHA